MAFLVGSFLNAYVMSKMKIASQGRNFSARAILSTIVGETADSLIFFPIAFGGIIAWKEPAYHDGTSDRTEIYVRSYHPSGDYPRSESD